MEMFTFDGAVWVAAACVGADCCVSVLCTEVWMVAVAESACVTPPLSPGLAILTETLMFAAPGCVAAADAWPASGAVGATGATGAVVVAAGTTGGVGVVSACAGAARPSASVVTAAPAAANRFRERAAEILKLLAWRSGHA